MWDLLVQRMVWHFFMAEDELGQRVGDGLGISADDGRDLPSLPTQQLSEAEHNRLENLGKNGPRESAMSVSPALSASRTYWP